MDHEKMGQFICALRKDRHMTQKDLAEQLHITDKAVSKWERGLSCPDIALLPCIAEILGVSVAELLNGEKDSSTEIETVSVEQAVDYALQYGNQRAEHKVKSLKLLWSAVFSVLLFLGMAVCLICDVAITGKLTWSLYPVYSIVFAWLVLFPVFRYGTKGLLPSLISLTICILPFLWLLGGLTGNVTQIMRVGVRASASALVYLWLVYVIFRRLKARKLLAAAVSLLLLIPAWLVLNFSLMSVIHEQAVDLWDMAGILAAAALAGIFWALDAARRVR